MKTYKVKVTYTNGSVLVTEVKGKGRESVKEEIKRDKMYFIGYPLEVKEVEILSNKIDKKLIEKFDDQLRGLGVAFSQNRIFWTRQWKYSVRRDLR